MIHYCQEFYNSSCLVGQFNWDSSEVELKPFLHRRLELSVQDGVILWGNRVVVPPQGRDLIIHKLHACHPGIVQLE